jgi:hypothetical protein
LIARREWTTGVRQFRGGNERADNDRGGVTAATAAAALGVARSVFGVAMAVAPALLPRLLGADATTARRLGYLTRMVAARELALGVGTLRAVGTGDDLRSWFVAQAMSDAGDAVAIAAAVRAGRVNRVAAAALVLFATGGAAGDALAFRLASRAD